MAAFEFVSCTFSKFCNTQLFGWPGAVFFGAWQDPCVLWSVPQPQCLSFSLSLVAGLDFLQY